MQESFNVLININNYIKIMIKPVLRAVIRRREGDLPELLRKWPHDTFMGKQKKNQNQNKSLTV